MATCKLIVVNTDPICENSIENEITGVTACSRYFIQLNPSSHSKGPFNIYLDAGCESPIPANIICLSHGHLDHIGAIPFVLEKLGNPPIYSRQFGAIMILKKMEDFPHLPKPNMQIIEGDEVITADFTFAATVEVIALLHLTPVLVDVNPDDFNISILFWISIYITNN